MAGDGARYAWQEVEDMNRIAEFRANYGPWALVTGASSGIGEQFVRLLARSKLNVLAVARREDRLTSLAREFTRRNGPLVEPVVADLADPGGVDRVVAAAAQRDLGLVVSNAGFGLKGAFVSSRRDELEAMLNVNARTPMLLLHALLPRLLEGHRGGVILTGSQEGESPFPWSAAYGATKAFVHSLGLALYGELSGTGVDLLVLAPGATDTEAPLLQGFKREALPPLMAPADVAKQALHQLGRTPFFVPGVENRKFVALLRRMPREKAIAFNAQNMSAALAASGKPVGEIG
jgi:short-subunit dehydrogenase